MARTTRSELDGLACRIDRTLGAPEGTHYIGHAYGRPRLHKLNHPGSLDVSPRLPASQLADWMRAYIAGIWEGRIAQRIDDLHESAR